MPTRRSRSVRAPVTGALAALLIVLSVLVPQLDRGMASSLDQVSAGELSTEWSAHDHRICLQHSATAWIAGFQADAPRAAVEWVGTPFLFSRVRPDPVHRFPHSPRAPPLV